MDAEVTYSEPQSCELCGEMMRIRYINGEFYHKTQVEPMFEPTPKNPNPIYQLHKCEEDDV